ncbi:MAG: hypothetical protein ACLSEX_06685 [Blautia sp.]
MVTLTETSGRDVGPGRDCRRVRLTLRLWQPRPLGDLFFFSSEINCQPLRFFNEKKWEVDQARLSGRVFGQETGKGFRRKQDMAKTGNFQM